MKKKWKNLFLLKLASSKAENDSKTSQQNGNNHIMPSANGHASESALTSTLSRQQRSGVSSVGVYTGLDNSVQIIAVNGETSTSFEYIPLLKNAGSSEIRTLFLKKLKLCGCMFDFSDMKTAKSREVKLQTLAELGEFISNGFFGLDEDIVHMVSLNIFRPLVPPHRHRNIMPEGLEPEEEEPALDPSWPHLQYVYEILLKYVVSPETDPKIAKKYIDHFFLLRLLDLFDSEDSREREYLKTILHRIYGRFMVHRPFIRKAINNIFYRFIFETEKHNGIAELLEILGSIISGFALPLKDEYKSFLVRALIPLHKSKNSATYQQQLTYCVTQFIEKDPTLADNVIQGLLKYWPITNSQKEILFLGEIEEVLEGTQSEEFQRCMVPLFRQIGRCLNSFHFQVAERAFLLLNNDHILRLVAENREIIFPLIFGALERNRSHWNQTVHTSTLNVRKMFLEMDLELFKKCEQAYKENEAKTRGFDEKRDATWKRLEAVAASRTSSSEAKLAQPVPNDNVMGFGSMTKFTARVVINLTWKFVFNLVFAFIRAFQLPWVLRCCTEALLQRRRNERIEFSVL